MPLQLPSPPLLFVPVYTEEYLSTGGLYVTLSREYSLCETELRPPSHHLWRIREAGYPGTFKPLQFSDSLTRQGICKALIRAKHSVFWQEHLKLSTEHYWRDDSEQLHGHQPIRAWDFTCAVTMALSFPTEPTRHRSKGCRTVLIFPLSAASYSKII